MREYGDTFLLGPFREFYKEVIRLKAVAENGALGLPGAAAEAEDLRAAAGAAVYFPDFTPGAEHGAAGRAPAWFEPSGAPELPAGAPPEAGGALALAEQARVSSYIWHSLVSLFKRQERQALLQGGTYVAEVYREAQYVMVALADDIFLNLPWEGRRFWLSNLLETKLFGSQAAGERIFKNLDRLLAERDPVNRGLCTVYLMALSLGFCGMYRDGRGEAKARLLGYRRQLFSFVFQHEPGLANESRRLFPEAYSHTARDEAKRRLPNPRAWLFVLAAVVVAYVAITHGVWVRLTSEIADVTCRITRPAGEVCKETETETDRR